MKRIISLTLAALMLISVFVAAPVTASAYGENYGYNVLDDGTAILTYYYSSDTSIEIPSTVDDYVVSEIDEGAIDCYDAVSITIPASVKWIDSNAFLLCDSVEEFIVDSANANFCAEDGNLYNKAKTDIVRYAMGKKDSSFTVPSSVTTIRSFSFSYSYDLTSVTIPSSVTTIGEAAFEYCGLTSIAIPDSVTSIGSEVFNGCEDLATATLSSNINSVPDYTFSNCKSLTGTTIPDSVKLIGDSAFAYCESLENVNIGKNVESIGQKAFRECVKVTSITIPEKTTEIDNAAFSYCTALTGFVVEPGNTYFRAVDGNLYDYSMTSLKQYAIGKTATSFTVPDGVETICACAFGECAALKNVSISDDVLIIDSDAFYSCSGLTSIVIPDNVYYIGDYAFAACANAATLTLGSSVEEIGYGAFDSCYSIKSITIPDSVTYIDDEAFEECRSASSIKIGSGLTDINDFAFYGCSSLKSLTIPNNVKTIGYGAFMNGSSLSTVTIGTGVTSIDCWAFYDCKKLKSISVPKNVKTIEEGAFGYYLDDNSGDDKKISGFKIYGYQNTAAQTYAKKNGFTFDAYDKTTVKAKAAKSKIYVGGKTTVKVTVKNRKGSTKFTSSNKKIATVNSKGVVKGIKAGKVTITATNNGVKSKVKIKVVKKTNPIKVKGKTVQASAYGTSTFDKGKILTITKAKGKLTFTKKSGDKKIYINKKTGKLTVQSGLSAGKTYSVKIAVKAAGNKTYKSATKTVTVKVKV